MPGRGSRIKEELARYYDSHGILKEIVGKRVEFDLDGELRDQILKGRRTHRLENISIKLDPAQNGN